MLCTAAQVLQPAVTSDILMYVCYSNSECTITHDYRTQNEIMVIYYDYSSMLGNRMLLRHANCWLPESHCHSEHHKECIQQGAQTLTAQAKFW